MPVIFLCFQFDYNATFCYKPNRMHTYDVLFVYNRNMLNLLAVIDVKTWLVLMAALIVAFVVHRRQRSNRKYPPSLPWLPVVGSLPFMGKPEGWPKLFMEKSWKLGNVIGFHAGPRYFYVRMCVFVFRCK